MKTFRILDSGANSLTLLQLPVLQDNYIYMIYHEASGEAAVIDPALAAPVEEVLAARQLRLTDIFNTHHHGDHVGGNGELVTGLPPKITITGYGEDSARIPHLTRKVADGDILSWHDQPIEVLFLPGHTIGHIAYYLPLQGWLFCGDVLFLMGCGRLFEGTPMQMFASLTRLKTLPPETLICCAHEYTLANGRFALSVDPHHPELQQRMRKIEAMRAAGQPTVPATLAEELATNPFLRAENIAEFTALREARNHFFVL
jgi:hydroxyacylglutathione hydrolase